MKNLTNTCHLSPRGELAHPLIISRKTGYYVHQFTITYIHVHCTFVHEEHSEIYGHGNEKRKRVNKQETTLLSMFAQQNE